MLPFARTLSRARLKAKHPFSSPKVWSSTSYDCHLGWLIQHIHTASASGGSASSPSLSIWRRKKEIGKEGLIVAKELKRLQLQPNPVRLERYIQSNVSRLLKSDLVAVLAEFQRQDQVFLCMKLYDVVRKEIWYHPDMFFYRDMLMFLARNQKVEEVKQVWGDLKREEVLFDQHTFGDIVRAFLDHGLPEEAMEIYDEMRSSPDPPLSLPYRVMLKGLIPYPELREKVKGDFLELFPDMIVFDLPEDLFEDQIRCRFFFLVANFINIVNQWLPIQHSGWMLIKGERQSMCQHLT